MNIKDIQCCDIIANPADNRSRSEHNRMNPADCEGLAKSIENKGLLQPVIVRPDGDTYKLVAGFRRFTACHILLGWETMPCVVTECQEYAKINLIENIQRHDLTLWEEIVALRGTYDHEIAMSEIQKDLGMSKMWVNTRWKSWNLPEEVKQQIAAGMINFTQLVILIKKGIDPTEAAEKIRQGQQAGKSTEQLQKEIMKREHVRGKKSIQKVMTKCLDKGERRMVQALRFAAGEIEESTLWSWIDRHRDV